MSENNINDLLDAREISVPVSKNYSKLSFAMGAANVVVMGLLMLTPPLLPRWNGKLFIWDFAILLLLVLGLFHMASSIIYGEPSSWQKWAGIIINCSLLALATFFIATLFL